MAYLLTFLWSLPSGFLWIFNAEAMVVAQVSASPDVAPWLIALVTVTGQFLGYGALYHFARRVLARFAFVQRAASKVQIKQPGWGTWIMFVTGGLCGIPPLLALFTLCGAARVKPVSTLILCALPGRFAWYMGWAYAPDFLRETFGWKG